jgi:hypothetical protein
MSDNTSDEQGNGAAANTQQQLAKASADAARDDQSVVAMERISWADDGVQIKNMSDAWRASTAFYKSGYFPDVKSAAQALVKVQVGAELGFKPMASMQGVYLNEKSKRLGYYAPFQLAKIMMHAGRYVVKKWDHEGCTIEWYRNDWMEAGKYQMVGVTTFDRDDAIKGGLIDKDTYTKWARDMYFDRCVTRGRKMYFSDVFNGGADIDEIPVIDVELDPPTPGTATAKIEEPRGGSSALRKAAAKTPAAKGQAVVDAVLDGPKSEKPAGEAAAAASTPTPPPSTVDALPADRGERQIPRQTPNTAPPSPTPQTSAAGQTTAPTSAPASTPAPATATTAAPASTSTIAEGSAPAAPSSPADEPPGTAPTTPTTTPPKSGPPPAPGAAFPTAESLEGMTPRGKLLHLLRHMPQDETGVTAYVHLKALLPADEAELFKLCVRHRYNVAKKKDPFLGLSDADKGRVAAAFEEAEKK